ncbi:hypothetical protein H4R19_001137 [Coemansia spiralis]|nr:hypothetical protein H4R19_001137 [Coemansia spiralis]
MLQTTAGLVRAALRSRPGACWCSRLLGTAARADKEEAASMSKEETASRGTEELWIKRRPLPTTTSMEYKIPTDPYLLVKKFQEVTRIGKLDDAVAIVMQTKTRNQSVVVWNLVINEYAQTGRLSRALRAYTEMRKRGFKPTQTTFTALLKACAHSTSDKRVAMAEHLLDSMPSHGIEPSIINHNALLDVYQRQHNLTALLEHFNVLPGDGPGAPSLETYTIAISACRRELQRRLDELASTVAGNDADKKPTFGDSRRTALVKGNVRSAFTALMDLWTTYVDDAVRRLDQPQAETPRLEIDTHIVRVVLKACHAVYSENRALGRRGIDVAEQVYGFDRDLGAAPKGPPHAAAAAPLAVRLRNTGGSGAGSAPGASVDSAIVDLVLGLCRRDKQYTKAIRFWRSLETHFADDAEPLREQHADLLRTIQSQVRIPLPQAVQDAAASARLAP